MQGWTLANQLYEIIPATNFTQNGIFKIRDAKGETTDLPVEFAAHIKSEYWENSYLARQTNFAASFVQLKIVHKENQSNEYFYVQEQGGSEYEQKFILPKRLNENQIATSFAGSDFWICDLGLEFFHWPAQKILKHEIRRSRGCAVLESTNPSPAANGYSRVVSWIDSETLGIIHAEAYDAQNKLLKEFDPKSFKKVNGQWELQEMEISNVQTGSRTRLEFDLNSK